MEYNKLPPNPPPYSPEPGWNMPPGAPPSAPPTELMQPAPVMYMAAPPQPVNVVTQNTVVVDNCGNGMVCPHCNARVRLRVEHHATCTTYLWSAILCLFLCWPCVCLPCCCNCGYKTSQFCPNCKACLGKF